MISDDSRYAFLELREKETTEGRRIRYITRRMLPPAEIYETTVKILVTDSDRLDNIAHRSFGSPTSFWQIADANEVMHPDSITEQTGQSVVLPIPKHPKEVQ